MVESNIVLANVACAVVAGIASIFFIVGVAGYSSSEKDLRNVPWFFTTDSGTISFGLRAFSVNSGGPPVIADYSDGAECNGDFCDKCEKDGQAAVALVILALFISITVTSISAAQTVWCNRKLQTVAAGLSALSVIFVVIALGLVLGDCYNEVSSTTQLNGYSFEWGAGSVLALVGAVLMTLATVFLTIAVWLGNDAVKQRTSSVDGASSTVATMGAHDKAMYAHPHLPEDDLAEEPTAGLVERPPERPSARPGAVPATAEEPVDLEQQNVSARSGKFAGTPGEPVDLEQQNVSARSGKFRACSISISE